MNVSKKPNKSFTPRVLFNKFTAASFVVFLVLAGFYLGIRYQDAKNFREQAQIEKQKKPTEAEVRTFKEYQDEVIKSEVQTAVSILDSLYKKSKKKEISFEEAKKTGADIIRNMRYGDRKEGYFWVDTAEGVNVVLYGNKEVEGKNRMGSLINGVYYIKEIIKNGIRPGGGYTNYFFPKINGGEPLAKRSYSLLYAPFNWVVGTGYYLKDMR